MYTFGRHLYAFCKNRTNTDHMYFTLKHWMKKIPDPHYPLDKNCLIAFKQS